VSNTIEANRRIRELGAEAQAVLKNSTLTNATKKAKLDGLQAELEQHKATLALHQKSAALMVGGETLDSPYAMSGAIASGRAMKGLATPSLKLSHEMQQGIYNAAKSGQNLRVELKDAASSDATRTQLPASYVGLVDRKFESFRLLSHIPSTATEAPSIEYLVHTANTVAIGTPVITLGSAAAGGTFAAATYYWKLTATNTAGETVGSNELTATLTANQKQPINWTQITGANGYRLYRGTAAGAENVLVAVITGGATVTYTDLGAAGTNATVPTIDRTAGAAPIAAGGQYPETNLTTVPTILSAKKIGIFTTVVDELLADFPTFGQYLDVELSRQVQDAESWQLIQGDGTGNNLLGLLNVSGTLSRIKGAGDTSLDVIEQGITDLRNGPTVCEPDALIIHPSTWSTIRRAKNSQGNYILGDPGQSTVSDVWGVPVLQTTQITPGVAILGNLELAAQAYIREGMTLAMTNSADADFTGGKVKIRTSERLVLTVPRPTALNVLTGL
jgi:hypothetical protein